MADKKSPKGVPLLSLKLTTIVAPQLQGQNSPTTQVAWTGNVGTQHYFLGNKDTETASDEDLYQMFLQKEGEYAVARNSSNPFQYSKPTPAGNLTPILNQAKTEKQETESGLKEPLQRVKDDTRDSSYEAWANQMHSMMQLRKEEQRGKQTQQ